MALDNATRTAVHKLHKGLGVRQARLPSLVLTTKLGELWHVTRHDLKSVLLAKVIYRLEEEFRNVCDRRIRRAAPVIYNTLRDPEMHDLDLGQRQDLLRDRHPDEDGYSKRSMSRIIHTLGEAIEHSLLSPLPAIPEAALLAIMRREAEFTDELSGRIGPSAFTRLVGQSYTAPMDASAAFLRLPVLVPRSHTNDLIIARTADQGDWLCVFSTQETQRAHQNATPRQPWSGSCSTILGAELVHTVVSRWSSVGILVDPPASRSADSGAAAAKALRLPPSELTRLADGR